MPVSSEERVLELYAKRRSCDSLSTSVELVQQDALAAANVRSRYFKLWAEDPSQSQLPCLPQEVSTAVLHKMVCLCCSVPGQNSKFENACNDACSSAHSLLTLQVLSCQLAAACGGSWISFFLR